MRNISIIGSTGSIGVQSLDVIDKMPEVSVTGISGNNNINLLEKQIRKYKPKFACAFDESNAKKLKISVADTNTKIYSGMEGLCKIAADSENETVITSVVGIAGLIPTVLAIKNGVNIALANKETLVTAGKIVKDEAKKHNVKILPVDSEHCAIFQCIGNEPKDKVKRLIITASGGSFYGKKINELKNVTVTDALNHPNWSMGKKITIDSATLMNKGLEVIEAHWLFDMPYEKIDVVVHRESVIHSMVEFIDTSVIAQMGLTDMRLPIHYALNYPNRENSYLDSIDFTKLSKLTFNEPDYETFKCLKLAINAGKMGGIMPTVLNAANEVSVAKFLNGEIKFLEIAEIVEKTLNRYNNSLNPTLQDIIDVDKDVRASII